MIILLNVPLLLLFSFFFSLESLSFSLLPFCFSLSFVRNRNLYLLIIIIDYNNYYLNFCPINQSNNTV